MSDIRQFRESETRTHRRASDLAVVCGFLDEDLDAATDPLTGAATALMTTVEWDSDNADPDPADCYETGEQVRVVNRTQRTASEDFWCVAIKVNGEWLVIDTSCTTERP